MPIQQASLFLASFFSLLFILSQKTKRRRHNAAAPTHFQTARRNGSHIIEAPLQIDDTKSSVLGTL